MSQAKSLSNMQKYCKFKVHWHQPGKCRGVAHNVYNRRYKAPREIPAAFHNGSKYDSFYNQGASRRI